MNGDPRILEVLLEALRTNRDWFSVESAEGSVLTPVLTTIASHGLAQRHQKGFTLRRGARALLSQFAVRLGASASRATQHLRPAEFEDFVCSVLQIRDFDAKRRVLVTTHLGRAQFDVIGIRYHRAIFAECKKWRRKGALRSVCLVHAEKVNRFGRAAMKKAFRGIGENVIGFPLVVTLIPDVEFVSNDCLAVGMDKFGRAVDQIEMGEFDQIGYSWHSAV